MEECIEHILRHLPLRSLLTLRLVCHTWCSVIERNIFASMESLKIFGSLKALLDYYQFVNRDYNALGKPKSECHKHLVPGGVNCFPNFVLQSDPSDDHLIISIFTNQVSNSLIRLFPAVRHLLFYHIDGLVEATAKPLLHRLQSQLLTLQLFDVDVDPNGSRLRRDPHLVDFYLSPETITHRPRYVPRPTNTLVEHNLERWRHQLAQTMASLTELTLDGRFVGNLETMLGNHMHLSLRHLRLFRFNEKTLLGDKMRRAIEHSNLAQKLDSLTIDCASYAVVQFCCRSFPRLCFFDVAVDEHFTSYDLIASIANLQQLNELRIRSPVSNFFEPIKFHYIFAPMRQLKRLHLYLLGLGTKKMDLIASRLFPALDTLIFDSGLIGCDCKTFKTRETSGKQERIMKPIKGCSVCLHNLLQHLQSNYPSIKTIGCHDSGTIIDVFFALNQQLFCSALNQKLSSRRAIIHPLPYSEAMMMDANVFRDTPSFAYWDPDYQHYGAIVGDPMYSMRNFHFSQLDAV